MFPPFPMWSFIMSYNIGGLKLAQYLLNRSYPLCTNGSSALGRWTRCQGQRSAVLQWWTSVLSTSSDYQIPPLPIPSRPAPRHAARRCQWPIFLFPLSSRLARRTLFVPRLLADPRAPVIFMINDCRPFVQRRPWTGLCWERPRRAKRVQFYNHAFASAMMCTFFDDSRLSRRESVELIVESSASVETGI